MIKINLLPTKAAKKRSSAAGSSFLLIALLLVAAEGVGLYLWSDSVSAEVTQAQMDAKALKGKVAELQKVKQAISDAEEKRQLLEEQNRILEKLRDGKEGPPNMLLSMGYVLTKPPDTKASQKELKALEKAGWNMQWDSDSVWIKRLTEDEWGQLSIEGEARSHEDVAEFFRRMRTVVYFRDVQPGPQEVSYDQGIEMAFVAFKGSAELNYVLPSEEEEAEAEASAGKEGEDTVIIPGTPSVEAVPGAGGK